MKINNLLIAIAFSSVSTLTFGQTISQQSSQVEMTMYENKKNNLPKYNGIETNYIVKIGGLDKYAESDLEQLSSKLKSHEIFKEVSISDNKKTSLISILTNGDITPNMVKLELRNQGFEIFDISGEMQLTNNK